MIEELQRAKAEEGNAEVQCGGIDEGNSGDGRGNNQRRQNLPKPWV
jgi:hypothetical protein